MNEVRPPANTCSTIVTSLSQRPPDDPLPMISIIKDHVLDDKDIAGVMFSNFQFVSHYRFRIITIEVMLSITATVCFCIFEMIYITKPTDC